MSRASGAFNFLFIGNPGVGKSTLLNGMVREALFKSGLSYGKGMTYKLDVQRPEGQPHTFMDTPGLADAEMRQQAAAAITEALKQSGHYKVFFVITLEAGRVKPADVTTMKLVLDAAPTITSDGYGIILNQLPPKEYRDLKENPRKEDPSPEDMVRQCLWGGLPSDRRTVHIHYMKRMEDLEGEDDAVPKLPDDLIVFINVLPGINIAPPDVGSVRSNEFDEVMEQNAKIIREMQEANKGLQEALKMSDMSYKLLREDLEKQQKQREAESKRWEKKLELVEREYKQTIEKMTEKANRAQAAAQAAANEAGLERARLNKEFESMRSQLKSQNDEALKAFQEKMKAKLADSDAKQRRSEEALREASSRLVQEQRRGFFAKLGEAVDGIFG